METEIKKAFEPFELVAALLLGAGAIGAAIAGHQEGLWGGQSVEAYGESTALTTKASATYNDELITYLHDSQTDVRAKELIWDGNEATNEGDGLRKLVMGSWLLLSQLSRPAYDALQLPADKRKAFEEAKSIEEANEVVLEEDALLAALNGELDQNYFEANFAGSAEAFKVAEARFSEGRVANSTGDLFSLAGVIFTISLFFSGISLVFKTGMRWAFLAIGGLVFVGALVYMLRLPWA